MMRQASVVLARSISPSADAKRACDLVQQFNGKVFVEFRTVRGAYSFEAHKDDVCLFIEHSRQQADLVTVSHAHDDGSMYVIIGEL